MHTTAIDGGLRMHTYRTHLAVLLIAIFMVLGYGPLYGQTGGGTIEGTVTDPSGGVIQGATVTITSETTGVARTIPTNSSGVYSASDLAAGRYTVKTSAAGFDSERVNHILLTVGAVRNVDVHLTVGAAQTTVTVTSLNTGVDTATSTVQGVVGGKQIRELPLNGRDFTQLAVLQPGVSEILTQFGASATSTTRLSRGLGSQLTIGGSRPEQINYRLDGVSINDYANGSPGSVSGLLLGVDAVQEFSVIRSNAPAQYGRMSGGVVNSITRSGTNQFHGSVYEFVRNSVFDARNYFDPATIPSFRRNQFGAAVGGPIIRNRTFFFGNYEGFRQSQGASIVAIVPSLNARQGDLTTGKVTISPKVLPFLALYQLPNGSTTGDVGDYKFVTQVPTNEDFSTVHLDHNLSSFDTLHGTALYDTSSTTSADPSNAVIDEALSRRATGMIEEVHIFSPQLTNAVRFGYSRSVAIAPLQQGVVNPAAADPALGYFPGDTAGSLLVSGLTTFNGGVGSVGTYSYHFNSDQLFDDATLLRGKHSISYGGSVEWDQDNTEAGLLPHGSWSFGSIKNFLTNKPTYFESGLPSTPVEPLDLRTKIFAGYVQDDWRYRSNLTLNLGLRYEMNTNVTEVRNRLGAILTPTSPAPVPVHSYFRNNPTLKNFEPRVGFSWDPFKQGKSVLRGAIGLYDVLPLPYIFDLQALSSAPVYDEGENTAVPAGSFPLNGFTGFTPLLRVIYTTPKPGRSYEVQYSLGIQQQLSNTMTMTLGYVGSHGVREPFNTNNFNIVQPILKSPLGYVWPKKGTAQTLNPALGTITGTFFVGSSLYNSLQATLQYIKSQYFQGQVSYTWSRSVDDSSSALSGSSFSNSIPSPNIFDMTLNKALSDYDIRNVLTANAVATLPSLSSHYGKWAMPLRGWALNGILNLRNGLPFTPIIGGDPLGTLSTTPIPDFPDRVKDGSCTHPQSVFYLDTSCFAFPAPYQYAPGLKGARLGNDGRNAIIGPGVIELDLGVQKNTPITKRLLTQFQFQAFNVTNHTNYALPASTQTQIFNVNGSPLAAAGKLTSTSTSSRQLQFSFQLIF